MPGGNAGLARIPTKKDRECRFYPKCLDCPFPDCLTGTTTGRLWLGKAVNKKKVINIMREWGATNKQIEKEVRKWKIKQ